MKDKVFDYKTRCKFIGFQNCGNREDERTWEGTYGDGGFEKALAYLDNATGGDLTVSKAIFHVKCNAKRKVDELIPAVFLSSTKRHSRDKWDGYRYYSVNNYKCPICKKTGTNEEYLYTKEAESDMQKYGYRGANYGC